MTREEFIASYCQRANTTWERLSERRDCVPCDCGERECEGWKMVPKEGDDPSADVLSYEQLVNGVADAIRQIPWQHRPSFLFAIRQASGFCWECGIDLDGRERCHCMNDE